MRPELERIAARFGARVKVVEVPPGPPVLSPLVAEIYGPDEAGRHAVAKRVRAEFGRHAEIVGIDDSIEDSAPKESIRIDQARAASLGVASADVVAAMHVALDGDDVTMLHDAQAKYGVPVRLTLPPEQQAKLDSPAGDEGARQRRRAGADLRGRAGHARSSASARSTTRICCRCPT